MQSLVESGAVVLLALAVLALEAVVLVAWRVLRGRGPALLDVLLMLLAGAGLLVALGAALRGAGWEWIAAGLALGLVGHAGDLARRVRRRG